MQEDVLAVVALWGVDQELRKRADRLRALDKAVSDAEARLAALDAEIAAGAAAIASARRDEVQLQRRLDEYTTNRDRARRLLDTGAAADYHAVERQFQQCATIVDDLETSVLQSMEKIEAMEAQAAERARSRTLWAARHREAQADREDQAPPLQAEIAELQPQRAERWSKLVRDDRTRYEDLTRRGQEPIATLTAANTCSACNMLAPPQMVLEVGRGTRTHTCRGCRRWFVTA